MFQKNFTSRGWVGRKKITVGLRKQTLKKSINRATFKKYYIILNLELTLITCSLVPHMVKLINASRTADA